MGSNLTRGIVQVFDPTTEQINDALREIQNRIDEAIGLRGQATSYDDLQISKGIALLGTTDFLKSKIYEIGEWNMDTVSNATIIHGLSDYTKVRRMTVIIRPDATNGAYLSFPAPTSTSVSSEYIQIDPTFISLFRAQTGQFDSASYSNTSGFNRGWVIADYL